MGERYFSGGRDFGTGFDMMARIEALEVKLATARADALREAAEMVKRIAEGYDAGGDRAIACGLYLTAGNIASIITKDKTP